MTERTNIATPVAAPAFSRPARLLAAALFVAFLAPAAFKAHAAEAIRIGVPYVPPAPRVSDTRLYTEEGFELDLAHALGARLGRPVELVAVPEDERDGALAEGRIDLAVGGGAAGRFAQFTAGPPEGLAVAMRGDTAVRSWKDLAGRTVCIAQANERARRLAVSLGATVRAERAPARSLMRVRTGECDAAIHEKPLLDALFLERNWQKFSATLPPAEPAPLVVTVAPGVEPAVTEAIGRAVLSFGEDEDWRKRRRRWAANVAFEVYLDQDAPDCHS